jgi:hypothetical protein
MHPINEVTRRATEKPAKVLPLGRERQRCARQAALVLSLMVIAMVKIRCLFN